MAARLGGWITFGGDGAVSAIPWAHPASVSSLEPSHVQTHPAPFVALGDPTEAKCGEPSLASFVFVVKTDMNGNKLWRGYNDGGVGPTGAPTAPQACAGCYEQPNHIVCVSVIFI